MPLPTDTNLSLLGYSRPGDALHSKPKQAILVRMSSETLDALESLSSQPQVFFEFGQHPGIYIGESHFPMRYSQESAIHELFLRTSSATKKTAPLKLHANVMGKFAVERELADELRDKIRESTQDAANQRNTRTTVFIENPPDLQPNAKKKKEAPSMFRKPLRPADKPKVSASMPTPTPIRNPSTSTQSQKEGLEPLRIRLIQYLALGERTEEQVLQNVSGTEFNSFSRRDVRDILDNLAEATTIKSQSSDKSLRTYRLKPTSWREVRPYEWPGMTESQRTTIARSARIALQNLGIPQSDSVWAHVKYRSPTAGNSQQSSSHHDSVSGDRVGSNKLEAKKGLSSREAKEKIAKPPVDKKKAITMKDESIKATTHVTHQDGPSSSLRRPPPTDSASLHDKTHNRTPSSQVPKPKKINNLPNRASTPVIGSRSIRQADNANSPSSSLNSSSLGQGDERYSHNKVRKPRPEDKAGSVDTNAEAMREKQRAHIEKRRANEVTNHDDTRSQSLKRKVVEKSNDDRYNTVPQGHSKKRKTDHATSSTSGRQEEKEVNASAQRKHNPASVSLDRPDPKNVSTSSSMKTGSINNSLPPRPTPATSNALPSSRSMSGNASSSSIKSTMPPKARRRSPIYTSSEEEEGSLPISETTSHPSSRTLPTDRASLRSRYNSTYLEYLATFQKLLVQRAKLDSLLKKTDLTTSGTITESDGDNELMDSEELARLTRDHKHLEEELESMQKTFGEV